MHYCSPCLTKVALLIQTGLGSRSELHYTEGSLLACLRRGLLLSLILQGLPGLRWFIAIALMPVLCFVLARECICLEVGV